MCAVCICDECDLLKERTAARYEVVLHKNSGAHATAVICVGRNGHIFIKLHFFQEEERKIESAIFKNHT